jgi:AcrR family transcriptional regulator
MPTNVPAASARRDELLERAYGYVLAHGLTDLSLRPLAAAVGSSPRVLLFLFGSKDELVRALLHRARADELELIGRLRDAGDRDLATTAAAVWRWLIAPEHRSLLRVWVESYAKSLIDPDGPWAGFARSTVGDWLGLLGDAQPPAGRLTAGAEAQRTLVLAVLRGALLDVLATGEVARPTRAVESFLTTI